jgi:hypothetical protein
MNYLYLMFRKAVKNNSFFNSSRCMNKVILLVLLMPLPAFGQIMENFESGNLSDWIQSPEGHWNTDNSNPVSGRYSLHHFYDNPDAGSDRIGLPVRNLRPEKGTVKWEFILRYSYDPSSSNNWAIYLMSDSDPSSLQNGQSFSGYVVGVNQTGYDDTLRLWKVKGGIFTTVINSSINWQTGIGITDPVRISVERSETGEWKLNLFRMNQSLIGTSSGRDSELFRHEWFVIFYRYTSTRDRLLWLDDLIIEGVFQEDSEPPEITGCLISGNNSLQVSFSEEVSDGSLATANFELSPGDKKAVRVTKKSSLVISIEFEEPFLNKSKNKLIISNLCDIFQNCRSKCEFEFMPVRADPGDVIISEIMADPLPAVSLPSREYIEIFNRTDFPFSLKNWTLSDGNTVCDLLERVILPRNYMILCQAQDTSLFSGFGEVMGLKSFPALTDDGKILYISDSASLLIHGIEYASDWYGNNLKTDGGWSLEIIDTDYPFFMEGNWHASRSKSGGSPGMINSISGKNPDRIFSGINNAFPSDSISISLRFSEPVFIPGNNIKNIETGGPEAEKLVASDPLMRGYILYLKEPLQENMIYTIRIGNEISDFAGNVMQKSEYSFGIPEHARQGDILFNELLFNPFPGEPDFIEFFNCSEIVIDASELLLVSVNDKLRDTSSVNPVSDEKRCILPSDYFVITSDIEALLERFFSSDPDKVFEIRDLPSMPDDEGHLILYGPDLDKIDEVFYDENMHFSLLGGHEGISIEKIRTIGKSSDKSQWHSASEASGWGTPGAPNSVLSELEGENETIVLSSTRITPDNDGFEDFLVIDLNLKGNGNVVSVTVFNETGGFVKKITDNLLAGSTASIVWNGTADDENLVNTGIYIILINVFDDTGKILNWKKVCTVIR